MIEFRPGRQPIYGTKFSAMWTLLSVTGLLGLLLAGCQPKEEITRHQVPKERSGLQFLREPASSDTMGVRADQTGAQTDRLAEIPDDQCTDRMIVGIIKRSDLMWFFKMHGSLEAMKASEPQWQDFLSSIRFSGSNPAWDLPEGWQEGEPRPMRTATLLVPGFSPPLEMAVSSLNADQDLLLNVNRWRAQMGQPPISNPQLENNLIPRESEFGEAYMFDVKGQFGGGMMPGLAANSGQRAPDRPASANVAANSAGPQIPGYEIPAGWEPGPTSAMVPVRLQKSALDPPLQITVVPLPSSVNEWGPNARRWAGEVGMSDLTDGELDAFTSVAEVDRRPGKILKLIPASEDQQRGLIAAMVVQKDIAWFVKLSGEKSAVELNEADFLQFLNSLKFSQ
jgi:hypothetical protein